MNGRMYMASVAGLAITTTNDIIQLRNTTDRAVLIHAVHVSQTSELTISQMHVINLRRGVSGATGDALNEWENDVSDTDAGVTAVSEPGTNVDTSDWDGLFGWNILQEFVWLPTPEMRLWLAASDHFAVALLNADTLTMNATIFWEEFGT